MAGAAGSMVSAAIVASALWLRGWRPRGRLPSRFGWTELLIDARCAGRGWRRHHKFRAAVDAARTGPDNLRVALA
jgi:hypothetical protein